MTSPRTRRPPAVRPRLAGLVLTLWCLLGAWPGGAPPATAQAPPASPPPAGGDELEMPRSDRAALRVERSVLRRLARLDDEMGLDSSPDLSADWPARLAAAIEAGGDDEPGRTLLLTLASELRRLGIEHTLGGRPGDPTDARVPISRPEGQERAASVARIQVLLDRLDRKLGVEEAPGERRVEARSSAIAPKHYHHAVDDCADAEQISGYVEGSTYYGTVDGDASCAGPTPSPDHWFRFLAPETGSYTFRTVQKDYRIYDSVLSLHSGCPLDGDLRELACSDDAGPDLLSSIHRTMSEGEEVWIRVSGYGGATIDYGLITELGRTIGGTVTSASNGQPLAGVAVEVSGGHFSSPVHTAVSAADGSYEIGVPAGAGSYYARVRDDRFVHQIYDHDDCAFGQGCHFTAGDPIPVSAADATGIDFSMIPGGRIEGRVLAAATGQPTTRRSTVYLYDEVGSYETSVSTDSEGRYELESLPVGTYHLKASATGYRSELWDDVPCPSSCDPTLGSAVAVSGGQERSGIDFALNQLGALTGVLTEEGTGTPVTSEYVIAYTSSGGYAGSDYVSSADEGSYRIASLPAADYFVRTDADLYRNELWDDRPCEPTCDATSGDPITVALNADTSGIDFVLGPKAVVSGTVSDAEGGDTPSVRVTLYDDRGSQIATRWVDGYWGEAFLFAGLDAGTYYVRAGPYGSDYFGTHEPELWSDVPCYPGCDPTAGTPIVLTSGEQRTDLDFVLERRGSVSGRIVDHESGEPLQGVTVRAHETGGAPVNDATTSSDGTYEILHLVAGSYRIRATSLDYQDEMWDDVTCGSPCDPTTGALVEVRSSARTPGVSFALRRLGTIVGTVLDALGGFPVDGYATIFDSTGRALATSYNQSDGYAFFGLQPGTYFVKGWEDTYSTYPYQAEVYSDLPCDPDCDVIEGTPIEVGMGEVVTGLDLHLARCPADSRAEVISTTIDGYFKALACDQIVAHDTNLLPGSELVLRSGRSVVFGSGFVMESGAKFRVIIEPDWSGADP